MIGRLSLTNLPPVHATWVELGVAAGVFAEAVCATRPDLRYIGIDRWSDHHDDNEMKRARSRLRPFPNAILCRNTFEEAARTMPEDSCDVVYVDGYAHTGQNNGRTLDLWWSKVKRGGWLCGHDFDADKWPQTFKAVSYFAGHRGLPIKIIPEPGGFSSWAIQRPFVDPVLAAGDVVLVGNGASLKGSGKGPTIDTFAEVVRFNHFKLDGHHADVGQKTTLWSCYGANAQTPRNNPPDRILYLHGAKASPTWYQPQEIWRVPLFFYDQIRAELRAVSQLPDDQKAKLIPSAGLVTCRWLLDGHRVGSVALAGFDHFSRTGLGVHHHYWLDGNYSAPIEHDGAAEAALFADLLDSGRCRRL